MRVKGRIKKGLQYKKKELGEGSEEGRKRKDKKKREGMEDKRTWIKQKRL